jgi:hypothetical protein
MCNNYILTGEEVPPVPGPIFLQEQEHLLLVIDAFI